VAQGWPKTGNRNKGAIAGADGPKSAVVAGFFVGSTDRWVEIPHADRVRQLNPRIPDACHRHISVRRPGGAGISDAFQRAVPNVLLHRVHLELNPSLHRQTQGRLALYCAGKTDAAHLFREFQRAAARPIAESNPVPFAGPCTQQIGRRSTDYTLTALIQPLAGRPQMNTPPPISRNGARSCAIRSAPRQPPLHNHQSRQS
jgi:hypothetical protein